MFGIAYRWLLGARSDGCGSIALFRGNVAINRQCRSDNGVEGNHTKANGRYNNGDASEQGIVEPETECDTRRAPQH
jgi:hypothetical protein